MKNESANRILEIVTGYDNAVKAIAGWAHAWNDSNGSGRMIVNNSGLKARDDEGSGEFYNAICLNINEAETCASEIYKIETCW